MDKEATRRHWQDVAADYTAHKEANSGYFDALKGLFAASLPNARDLSILEIGCGTGDVLRSLCPRRGLGLDLSEAMIAAARERHADQSTLDFRVADAENLPDLPLYDAVILPDLIEHVPDWRRTLAQAAAKLKADGRLAVSTPSPLWAPALYVLEKLRLKTPEGPHRFVGLRAIKREIRLLGLNVSLAGNFVHIPKDLGAVSALLNSGLARVPGLAGLGLIQFAVAETPAERRPDAAGAQ
jgi:2-polyprenyl-3-methyl-5-hydroxy-6-metoxy-1,4-benzoquinol methylase